MKKKFIKQEEWGKYIKSEEDLIAFMDSSPVTDIKLPPKTVFAAIHGSLKAHNARGTVYVFREDSNDTVLLNVDEYSFNALLNEEKSEMSDLLKTEYHHIDDIPFSLKNQAPEWVIDKIEILKHKSDCG